MKYPVANETSNRHGSKSITTWILRKLNTNVARRKVQKFVSHGTGHGMHSGTVHCTCACTHASYLMNPIHTINTIFRHMCKR